MRKVVGCAVAVAGLLGWIAFNLQAQREGLGHEGEVAPVASVESRKGRHDPESGTEQGIEVRSSEAPYRSAQFVKFRELQGVALRTKEQEQQRKTLLGDSELVQEAANSLEIGHATTLDRGEESRRLDSVTYLGEVMRHGPSPAREEAIGVVSRIVKRDTDALPAYPPLKRSYVGDQVELYQLLRIADRDTADRIRDESRGTPLRTLINFAIVQKRGNRT